MSLARIGARLALAVWTVLVCVSITAVPAWAGSGIKLCVPKKEGSSILTPKHGRCNKGYRLTGIGAEGKHGTEGKQGPEGKAGFTAAEAETLKALLPYVKFVASGVGGKPTVQFSGVNVQVVSGSGSTTGPVNGEGNLVVGYDESEGKPQTGSHNLVVGPAHSFTSFGGFLAGYGNTVTGPFGSVSGGAANSASEQYASVSGGINNIASVEAASISGGAFNAANGFAASVSGGKRNTAAGDFASILGGTNRTAGAEEHLP
jgi:hypothetical protein